MEESVFYLAVPFVLPSVVVDLCDCFSLLRVHAVLFLVLVHGLVWQLCFVAAQASALIRFFLRSVHRLDFLPVFSLWR
jgi:hypothetical protein